LTAQTIGFYLQAPPAWLAALLSALFAGVAWRMRWLNARGAFSTFFVGFLIFCLGGGKATIPLLIFFLTSSLLSKINRARIPQTDIHTEKGSTRDAGQVWANGGMAVAMVVLHRLLLLRGIPMYKLEQLPTLFLAALAAVNADTWATELGRLSGQTPRSLRDGKPVTSGTSGAISPVGTLAALAGAVVIPLSVCTLWPLNVAQFVCVAWAGFLGSLIDSLLGASLQMQYRDLTSGELTERLEVDGRVTKRVRGLRWMNNDVVNFLASLGSVLCAYYLLHHSHLM
jgi:uncharacterized protein (TIGR00297 family)